MLQVGCPSHRRFSVCHEHITIPGNQRAVPRKSLACVAHIVVDGTEVKSYQMKSGDPFQEWMICTNVRGSQYTADIDAGILVCKAP